jgi:hypothetical protein
MIAGLFLFLSYFRVICFTLLCLLLILSPECITHAADTALAAQANWQCRARGANAGEERVGDRDCPVLDV